ncbi:MAG TPA: hypothetical protein PLD02_01045, partial [Saprospiraceae bacterium]|nr:hypothetical protein [Saprospiraceae bacterium]
VIQRAQMEWHFVVLSSKLYRNFKNDLEELSNKIKRLEVYDNDLWNELKQFWEHVQKHIYDKNLLRDHSDSLREKSNSLFEELKKLRKVYANEFAQRSKETASGFIKKLEKIEERINNGSALQPLFNELKDIQSEYKALTLTKEDRDLIFVRIDQLFNLIREKREHKTKSGTNHETNTEERINKRYKGLIQVIRTMEGSISRDRKDIEYETKRIQTTTEQLESQIRVAKIRMIEDRIRSKQEKLEELLKTKVSLEKVAENIKKRAERQEQKNLDNARLKEEENKIKAKITNEIQTAQEAIQVEEEKLLQAAAKIKEGRRNKKIVLENKDQSDIQNSKAQNTLDDQLENKTDISNPLTEEEKREEE